MKESLDSGSPRALSSATRRRISTDFRTCAEFSPDSGNARSGRNDGARKYLSRNRKAGTDFGGNFISKNGMIFITPGRIRKKCGRKGLEQCSIKFFYIPADNPREAEDEYNQFVASVRDLKVRETFVEQGQDSFYSIRVEYLESEGERQSRGTKAKKPKVDYMEVLSTEDFQLFAKLRAWRNKEAERIGLLLG